jgi:DNA repair photolyase
VPRPSFNEIFGVAEDQLLTKASYFGGWSLNPYTHCDVRCPFCVTGAQGRSRPVVHPDRFDQALRAELANLPSGQLVAVGAFRDAYPGPEASLRLTRRALEILAEQGRPVSVVTRTTLVLRDLDLLRRDGSMVTISLATVSAELAARLEPGAPPPAERIEVARAIGEAGVPVLIALSPWTPEFGDVDEVLDAAAGIGVWVTPLEVEGPVVGHLPFSRAYDQAEIDDRFLEVWRRTEARPGVRWRAPQSWWGEDHGPGPDNIFGFLPEPASD